MTPSELKYNVEKTGSNFFSRATMKFFGDTMRNYGTRTATITTFDGEQVECWEMYRIRPVKHNLTSSAYFDKKTFERRYPAR